MKSYKETKQEMKKLIEKYGMDGLKNWMLNELKANGHDSLNVMKAYTYFYCRTK